MPPLISTTAPSTNNPRVSGEKLCAGVLLWRFTRCRSYRRLDRLDCGIGQGYGCTSARRTGTVSSWFA